MEIRKFLVLFCRYESPRTLGPSLLLPHLRTRRCVFLIWFSRYKFPCTFPTMLTGCPECPWIVRCNWTFCTVEELIAACETRFNVGFDFATILSCPYSSCILFAIVPGQLAELLKWLMLNKWKRLFHSSRVKLPFVNMSASWYLVSTYLM